MHILKNYAFLEDLVKDGQADKSAPFLTDGFCIADKAINPNHVFVFHFIDGVIWATYGWTKKKNKSFLEFYKKVEKIVFSFDMPIYRIGKNEDFRTHTKYVKEVNGQKIYQFIRSF